MDAKTYLEELERIDILIGSVKRKIDRLKASATSTAASLGGDRVQASRDQQKMADAVGSYVDIEKDELLPLLKKREKIIGTIKRVRGRLCFTVLYEHYAEGKSFKQIVKERRYSYSHVIRAHREGLSQIQRIIEK